MEVRQSERRVKAVAEIWFMAGAVDGFGDLPCSLVTCGLPGAFVHRTIGTGVDARKSMNRALRCITGSDYSCLFAGLVLGLFQGYYVLLAFGIRPGTCWGTFVFS